MIRAPIALDVVVEGAKLMDAFCHRDPEAHRISLRRLEVACARTLQLAVSSPPCRSSRVLGVHTARVRPSQMVDPGLVAAQLGPLDVVRAEVAHVRADHMPAPAKRPGDSLHMSHRRMQPQNRRARLLDHEARSAGKAERDDRGGPRRLLIPLQNAATPQVAPRTLPSPHRAVPRHEHPRRAHRPQPHRANCGVQLAKQLKSCNEAPDAVQVLVTPVVEHVVRGGAKPRRNTAVSNGLLAGKVLDKIEARVIAVTWGCKHNGEDQQKASRRRKFQECLHLLRRPPNVRRRGVDQRCVHTKRQRGLSNGYRFRKCL